MIYTNNGVGPSDTFIVSADSLSNNITFNITITGGTAPTAGPVSATVAYNSTSNPITLSISGASATGVAVSTQAGHGTATPSGTPIPYTPATA